MQRSRGKTPLWGRQVVQTVRGIRSRSKRRSLKSSNVYECLCLFARWLEQSHPRLSIAAVDAPCIRRYFSYLEHARHYKRFSLQIVQVVLRCVLPLHAAAKTHPNQPRGRVPHSGQAQGGGPHAPVALRAHAAARQRQPPLPAAAHSRKSP